ncbi:MAG: 50S ribosomal protein L9 [Chloroflexi bacterium RBG_16_48_8]|nr:MAG: 50S ribosomal protein L9 [Chloroflexi bacterium RBG_16_48_8]
MKVLLLQDVFKLGRAGDVKRVADGYGRNYLITQGLATLATPGALKQAEHIKKVATERRAVLNKELGAVSERIDGLELFFPVKAGETGRLYGSVTTSMIADAIIKKTGVEIDRKQVDTQPIKLLGVHKAEIRLTMDLVPEVTLIVHREGEPPETVMDKEIEAEDIPVEDFVELHAELEAMDIEATMQEEAQEADLSEEATVVEMSEAGSSSANQIVESPQEEVSEED